MSCTGNPVQLLPSPRSKSVKCCISLGKGTGFRSRPSFSQNLEKILSISVEIRDSESDSEWLLRLLVALQKEKNQVENLIQAFPPGLTSKVLISIQWLFTLSVLSFHCCKGEISKLWLSERRILFPFVSRAWQSVECRLGRDSVRACPPLRSLRLYSFSFLTSFSLPWGRLLWIWNLGI